MAKRKTIRVNPLDTLVPDPTTRQTGESAAAANAQSADPATGRPVHPHRGAGPKLRTAPYLRQPRRLHSRPLLPIS